MFFFNVVFCYIWDGYKGINLRKVENFDKESYIGVYFIRF